MVAPERRGIGKSLVELYSLLVREANEWQFRFYYQPRPDAALPTNLTGTNVEFVPLAMRGDHWDLWQEIRLPWQARREQCGLLHCPAQTSPLWKPCPTIVTIHDVIPIRFDEGWPAQRIRKLRRNIGLSIKDAAAIITVSDYSRKDLLKLFPQARLTRIERVYWAPERSSRIIEARSEILNVCARYSVRSKEYLFALGGDTPRKNTKNLLNAFEMAAEDKRFDLELLVGGLTPHALEEYSALIAHWRSRDRIHLRGYLPDEHMAFLFNGAKAFVFPSYYEGFGLPVLDAMACGCPVLASSRTSIPEIAGDAALYTEPDDVGKMAAAMIRIAWDSTFEAELMQAGLSRAAEFTWARAAKQTYKLFAKVLADST